MPFTIGSLLVRCHGVVGIKRSSNGNRVLEKSPPDRIRPYDRDRRTARRKSERGTAQAWLLAAQAPYCTGFGMELGLRKQLSERSHPEPVLLRHDTAADEPAGDSLMPQNPCSQQGVRQKDPPLQLSAGPRRRNPCSSHASVRHYS